MSILFKSLGYIYDSSMPYRHTALEDINLELIEGKITAIIGETGSGKSTLVQHLNALLLPTSGKLTIDEYEIEANKKIKGLKALREKVGLVFQFSEYQLFEETIIKDVAFGPKNFGVNEQEAVLRAKRALKMVGIDQSMYEQSPLELSGGQKRRVAIAGILAIDPKIIVLDEPTAGLDPKGAKEIVELFMDLNKKYHKTIIIVSHDNDMIYDFCDEVVLLSNGKIVAHKDVLSFFADDELLDNHNILRPQIVLFKKMLKDAGFKINDDDRHLNEIVKDIKRGRKK